MSESIEPPAEGLWTSLPAALVLRELGASPAVIAQVLEAIEPPAPVPAAELDALVRDVASVARPGAQDFTCD